MILTCLLLLTSAMFLPEHALELQRKIGARSFWLTSVILLYINLSSIRQVFCQLYYAVRQMWPVLLIRSAQFAILNFFVILYGLATFLVSDRPYRYDDVASFSFTSLCILQLSLFLNYMHPTSRKKT